MLTKVAKSKKSYTQSAVSTGPALDLSLDAYREFIKAKASVSQDYGFAIDRSEVNPLCKPHQVDAIVWAVRGGRRALFESFGLGKSMQQIEILRLIIKRAGGRGLIVAPLGVRQEFKRDARKLGVEITFVRSMDDVRQRELFDSNSHIYITNYETVRDGKLDPANFVVATLDESSVLRGMGGVKTFREFMRLFESVKCRFVATATPSPNNYIELLAYAAYLGISDVSASKTRFFKRDATKADNLTLHPHKESDFWLWLSTWALFLNRPSDLGHSDAGYDLPPLEIVYHEIPTDRVGGSFERDGQQRMFRDALVGVVDAAREKRETLNRRVEKMREILAAEPDEHFLLWHDLEAEREAIERAIPAAATVYGSQDLETREQTVIDFSEGRIKYLASKPVLLGSGCNFQYHCHNAIFVGIGFKFQDFIQACHRIHRFLQAKRVKIHIIYAESERGVLETLKRKWDQHNKQVEKMAEIIREFGLSQQAMVQAMQRSMGVERVEVAGANYRLVNNDCVEEAAAMPDNSVGLILSSPAFANQYEYTPSMNDFGHTESNKHFFEQMDFLTPHLFRVLQPGRIAAIHVKDRIVPGGLTGLGFQTVYPFHMDCIAHYTRHGFAYMGMKTIVTDVVRENNQTYRLGWTEQCKDGTKMGVGMPEYLLLFRKPPTDTTNSYADLPVVKQKAKYSRSRWQIDAHGFARSNGNRPPRPEELESLQHQQIFKIFRDYSLNQVYDFEYHVRIGEALERKQRLPVTFMLLQPASWHPDVWTDITRMRTLNGAQSAKGKQLHLCLARDSKVLTRQGYKPIQDVEIGDEVLTHKGRWRPVIVKRCTGVRPVVEVRAQGVPGLSLTPEHKLWTRKTDHVRERDGAEKAEPRWIEAKDTQCGYVNFKLPPVEETTLSELEWWIVGRWLADGHQETRGNFIVSVGPEKLSVFLDKVGAHAGGQHRVTAVQVRLKGLSEPLKAMLRQCGRGAAGKRLPGGAFTLSPKFAQSLLAGYLSGDGHYLADRKRWNASSVSRELLLGLAALAQRAYGTIASIYPGRGPGEAVIEGRTVKTKQDWAFCFDVPSADHRKKPFLLDDGAWKKVRSVEPAGEVETWNLRVEEDESYTAEGCIVKNCPLQFDIAERAITQWSMPGETVLDPFGGLMTVPMTAVKLGRRGVGVELNPNYFADGCLYVEAAAREVSMPTLFDIVEAEAADALPLAAVGD